MSTGASLPAGLLHHEQEPTDELPPFVTERDRVALEELQAAGWGEGDHGDAGLPQGFWGWETRS